MVGEGELAAVGQRGGEIPVGIAFGNGAGGIGGLCFAAGILCGISGIGGGVVSTGAAGIAGIIAALAPRQQQCERQQQDQR